ncbi:MAG: hypothetical protein PWQ55_545 [Chloroflexota bacterium]|nr:hypothetical protein [Chloroflexota bacterium]
MKRTYAFHLLFPLLILSACTSRVPVDPAPLPAEAAQAQLSLEDEAIEPTAAAENHYSNTAFGLAFDYPAGWFGPDEYVSGDTLRVEVGSDTVYPYGTGPTEREYSQPDSYSVVLQYTRSNQNTYWQDTYQTLAGMQDGQTVDGARNRLIRLRALTLGDLSGFEYIATLSDSAQTEAVYIREVILVNDRGDLLTLSGSPNNVEIPSGANWRELYRAVDEQNQDTFHAILSSIEIN